MVLCQLVLLPPPLFPLPPSKRSLNVGMKVVWFPDPTKRSVVLISGRSDGMIWNVSSPSSPHIRSDACRSAPPPRTSFPGPPKIHSSPGVRTRLLLETRMTTWTKFQDPNLNVFTTDRPRPFLLFPIIFELASPSRPNAKKRGWYQHGSHTFRSILDESALYLALS